MPEGSANIAAKFKTLDAVSDRNRYVFCLWGRNQCSTFSKSSDRLPVIITTAALTRTPTTRMTYGNRRHIPRDRKELIVSLSARYSPSNIARICNVSPRTVYRTLELWLRTGNIVNTPLVPGRPRTLNNLDIAVSCQHWVKCTLTFDPQYLEACIERTPDIYVSELKEELEEACGVGVSESTIKRTLRRRGFARKRVCFVTFIHT
jgi:transposase